MREMTLRRAVITEMPLRNERVTLRGDAKIDVILTRDGTKEVTSRGDVLRELMLRMPRERLH